MNYKDLNVLKLWKYVTDQLGNVTCINCCKYYVAPTTATCGHSLCNTCYVGRCNCASCGLLIDTKALRLNAPLQIQTEHAINLKHTFESLFNKQLDDFTIEPDQQQHVNEWLASSQNQFSAPVTGSQPFTEETVKPIHQVTSEIQVHSKSKKVKDPERKTIKMNIQQEDWDKIEEMPETVPNKSTENPIGPMDIETFDFFYDDKEYTVNSPRRSSRNKLLNISKPPNDVSLHKKSDNIFKMNSDKMTNKIGKDLKNIKRAKKKFSEINKKNRNKLNVSIEMCKKANLAAKIGGQSNLQQQIDNNTPEITATDEALTKNTDFNNQTNTDNVQNMPVIATNTNNIILNELQNKHFQCIKQKSLDLQSKTKENIEQINQNGTLSKVSFFKRGPLETTFIDTNNTHVINIDNPTVKNPDRENTDNIEITIKIGKLISNICIQKKENDVQLKINNSTDREIQTSLGNCKMEHDHNMRSLEDDLNTKHIVTAADNNVVEAHNDNPLSTEYRIPKVQIEKSLSTKKNTSSADTATAQIEITESEEREFANHMENVPLLKNQDNNDLKKLSKADCTSKSNNSENVPLHVTFINKQDKSTHNLLSQFDCSSKCKNDIHLSSKNLVATPEEVEFLNDVDIFDGEYVKEGNIQTLKSAKNTPSAILMPTIKSKSTSQKKTNKRGLDTSNTDLSNNKKMRHSKENIENDKKTQDSVLKENIVLEDEAENINYDAIMSQVFANINADMDLQRTQISNTQKSNTINFVKPIKPDIKFQGDINKSNQQKKCTDIVEKCSENVFSMLEKENGNSEIFNTTCHKPIGQTQHLKDKSTSEKEPSQTNMDIVEFGTPMQDDDDKSFVEETPQKKTSFMNESKTLTDDVIVAQCPLPIKDKSLSDTCNSQKGKDNEDSENIIISNSAAEITEIRKSASETPLTISNFVDKITSKSTPLARKSLNFDCGAADSDPEETICPSSVVAAKTTQEREFMCKAFEQTLESPSQTFCVGKQRARAAKLCVTGSCLMSSELMMLKELCAQRGWTYIDKFTKDLTHLVVGVDEENKAQRSVKFICALASSKWIVSFAWVEKCLLLKGFVDEEPFEALDATGEPGPRRSRLAKAKLLRGLAFYCWPPFTIIDIETLKGILEAAGGRVHSEPRAARDGAAPTILLAEPENTQEDRFIYLAMELKIVPVNYEWVLNCLGTYTLQPILDLLLCPASLLPQGVSCWPSELMSPSDE